MPHPNTPGESKLTFTTRDGDPDISELGPQDPVVAISPSGRRMVFTAGRILTPDHEPIDGMSDGAAPTLDGGRVVKIGGEVLDVTPPDLPPAA